MASFSKKDPRVDAFWNDSSRFGSRPCNTGNETKSDSTPNNAIASTYGTQNATSPNHRLTSQASAIRIQKRSRKSTPGLSNDIYPLIAVTRSIASPRTQGHRPQSGTRRPRVIQIPPKSDFSSQVRQSPFPVMLPTNRNKIKAIANTIPKTVSALSQILMRMNRVSISNLPCPKMLNHYWGETWISHACQSDGMAT